MKAMHRLPTVGLIILILIPFQAQAQTDTNTHIRALDSLDANTRIQAIRALAQIQTPEAIRAIDQVLRSDPSVQVRENCIEALAQIDTDEARQSIQYASENDRSERVRLFARSRCTICTERPSSPFESPPEPIQPAPAPVQPQTQPVQVQVQAPPPQPRPVAYSPPVRGVGTLAAGIALVVVSSIPFSIAGTLMPYWDACEWDNDTYQCGKTGSYVGSVLLFTLGGILSLAGISLIPIGASRIGRSRSLTLARSFTPFAAPTNNGAVFGISGIL